MESASRLGVVGHMILAITYLAAAVIMAAAGGWPGAFTILIGLSALAGTIVLAIAWLRASEVFGGLGGAAGGLLLVGLVLAVIVFVAVPGDREWGKLGAMVYAAGAAGVFACVSGLCGGAALLRARARSLAIFTIAGVGHLTSGACGLLFGVAALANANNTLRLVVIAVGAVGLVVGHAAGARAFQHLRPLPPAA